MNVATGLARLGDRSVMLTVLGRDKLGDDFLELLQGRDVDASHVQRSDKPTRDVLVTRTADGERTFAGFGAAAVDDYADCFVDAGALPADVVSGAAVLVSGTLGLAFPGSEAGIRRAVGLAKAGGATVVLDVNWRPVFWEKRGEAVARRVIADFLPAADLVKITDEEVEWLLDIPAADALAHPEAVLAKFPAAKGVLVSAGEKGCSYAFSGPGGKMSNTGVVPVFRVDVADTTGAGDAFLSGFIHAMLAAGGLDALAADPEKARAAVRYATACGAFTCTGPGAIGPQPTPADAEKLLAEN